MRTESRDTYVDESIRESEREKAPTLPPVPSPPSGAPTSVTFHYGGIDYEATVSRIVDADCYDLTVTDQDGGTFDRLAVMPAMGDDRDGRWRPSLSKSRGSRR